MITIPPRQTSRLRTCFFYNTTATTEIYTTTDTLSLHDALPISSPLRKNSSTHSSGKCAARYPSIRQIGRHTSELQSPVVISYAVFCLKKKKEEAGEVSRREGAHHLSPLALVRALTAGCAAPDRTTMSISVSSTATFEPFKKSYPLALPNALPI